MSAAPTPAQEWPGPARYLPPTVPASRDDGSRYYAGVTYAVPFGYRPLQLDLWVPDRPAPAPLVVWVHGGGWMFGDRRYLPETLRPHQIFDALLEAGLAVASIDYRLVKEAPFPAELHDVKAAIRYLRAYAADLGVDATRIGIWGESAGAHLAVLAALTASRPDLEGGIGVLGPSSAVDVVVDWYGPMDLDTMPRSTLPPMLADKLPELATAPEDQLLKGLDDQARVDASPISHVTSGAPPFLLVHGTADPLVPYAQSEQLEVALTAVGVPVRLVPVENAGHIFLGCTDIDALVRLSVDFLSTALVKERN